ncbi:hypothetical protein DXG01_010605 [Tephrocybe rancida]|nr:hypothetical protein DXG01_010605 [Tephrocybe rancida]
MKQEDSDALFSQLYTMPPLPPYSEPSKPNDTTFGKWSFENASSDILYPPTQYNSTTSVKDNANEKAHSTPALLYDQPNIDLSAILRIGLSSPSSSTSVLTQPRSPRSHIPRPPNAFMLYRSDFLKRGIIPSHVERRQQNLSRIAGQCWNLLPQEEKAQWQKRAAQVLLEHQKRNPDYKFTPAPRGSRRSKLKGRLDGDGEVIVGEDRIRQIREEYARIAGPTASPARRRRPRGQNRSRDLDSAPAHSSPVSEAALTLPPLSIPPSPSPSIPAPEIDYKRETPLPPFFPHHTLPHIIPPRRPSTSLGFATSSSVREIPAVRTGLTLARPSSAASETGLTTYLKDLDIVSTTSPNPDTSDITSQTPTAPTFGDLSSPGSPASPLQPTANHDVFLPEPPALQDELVFPTLNTPFSSSSPIEAFCNDPGPDAESFMRSLYSNDAFAYNLPIVPAEQEFASLNDTYPFDYDPSAFHNVWASFDTSLVSHTRSYTM